MQSGQAGLDHSTPRAGREAVLEALRAAGAPLAAADVADRLGLHPNTARGHLELLAHLGYATRAVEERTERGRPRILYCAALADPSATTDVYRTLATALAIELSTVSGTDQESADKAGELWANSQLSGRLSPSSDPDVAIGQVQRLFCELGFDAATEPLGDRIYLRGCPYQELVTQFPGICSLHLGLMRAAFRQVGDSVAITDMKINARPGLCVAVLERPRTDVAPSAGSSPEESTPDESKSDKVSGQRSSANQPKVQEETR